MKSDKSPGQGSDVQRSAARKYVWQEPPTAGKLSGLWVAQAGKAGRGNRPLFISSSRILLECTIEALMV